MAQKVYLGRAAARLRMKGWLTYEEAGAALNLSAETVRKYVDRGLLERGYFVDVPLISQQSVDWYRKHRTKPGLRDMDQKRGQEGRAKPKMPTNKPQTPDVSLT